MSNFLNDYETVDSRIHKFWDKHPNGRIATSVEYHEESKRWVVRTEIYRDITDTHPAATGHAEEVIGSSMVNKTAALENAETSSIGRCLANLSFSTKGARPSLEEMAKAKRQDTPPIYVDGANANGVATKSQLDAVVNIVGGFAAQVKAPVTPAFTLGVLSLWLGREVKDIHRITVKEADMIIKDRKNNFADILPKYEAKVAAKKKETK